MMKFKVGDELESQKSYNIYAVVDTIPYSRYKLKQINGKNDTTPFWVGSELVDSGDWYTRKNKKQIYKII